MQLLDRQYCAKVGFLVSGRVQSVLTQDGDFKELIERAENTLLEMKAVLRGSAFSDTSACFLDTFVEHVDDQEVFVMQSNMALPFDLKATVTALWKVLSTDTIDEYCYYHQVVQKSETVIVQTFGIRYVDDVTDVDFRGKYIFSRFKDGDYVVIVWVAECEPIEVNGTQCSGVQCQTTGWIQLSAQKSVKIYGTLARAYSRLNVVSPRDKLDVTPQLHSFLSLAQRMHDKFMVSFSSVLDKALIEEDWKMNGGCTETRDFTTD
ncbi:Hypothetical protein PHPALM_13894 [Phytophthora palmivora]|uniref:Uncharacterized protein n=1 Tax=Phytophthora palmivora TaxID=4796 RepID=A0A2P4XW62_9STRA|nr:Hypothetical protein PHPALM_13894 [Phytophthora palmivora]